MNTRKLLKIPYILWSIIASVCLLNPIDAKQNPGFLSPAQVSSMQEEREQGPIDKIELAKAQEKFKPRPVRYTKRGTPKKQRKISKTLRYMTYEETKEAKNKLLAGGNHTVALKYQERMIKLCDDLDELEAVMLEYADTHKICAHYDKAAALYTEFTNSFPGSVHIEYALYNALECSSHLILDAERDQTNTKKAIELADQFLARAELFAQYTDKVLEIRDRCYKNLARSECNVYTFYLNNGQYAQAERRLSGIRTEWIAKVPDLEAEVLAFEIDLAQRQKNSELASAKQAELNQKFPNIVVTQARSPQNFLTKF